MDYLRSCYTTTMRFSDTGPAVPVKWLRPKPGAPFLGVPTLFGSSVWTDANDPTITVGELQKPFRSTWSNGANGGAPDGTVNCGNDDDLENGVDGPYDPPRMVNGNGWPLCCNPPPPLCWFCGSPALVVTPTGGFDPYALPFQSSCFWSGGPIFPFVSLQADCGGAGGGPRLQATPFGPPHWEDQLLLSWDGNTSTATFQWVSAFGYASGTILTVQGS